MRIHHLFAVAIVFTFATCAIADAGVEPITFAGIATDKSFTAFTDPSSGVLFSNPVDDGNNLIVDVRIPDPLLPTLTPGLVLVGNGFSPSGLGSYTPNLGFTMTFPQLIRELDFTAGYVVDVQSATITLQGFDDDHQLISSSVTTINQHFGGAELAMSLQAGGDDLRSVTIASSDIGDSFGEFSISGANVPEPVALVSTGVLLLMCCRRRWGNNGDKRA